MAFTLIDETPVSQPTGKFTLVEEPQKSGSTLSNVASNAASSAARSAGLGARAVVNATLGLPVMLGEALNQGYNAITGSSRTPVGEGWNTFLNNAGLPEPANMPERLASDAVGGMSGVGLANLAAKSAAPVSQLGKQMAELLTSSPGRQTVAGATAGLSSGLARESGAGPVGQMAAGVAGGMLPFSGALKAGAPSGAEIRQKQVANSLIDEGYSVPPTASNPTITNSVIESFAGRPSLNRSASLKNQQTTNQIIRNELGVPPQAPSTPETLKSLIAEQGKILDTIRGQRIGIKTTDPSFVNDVMNINGRTQALANRFPEIAKNPDINELQAGLLRNKTITPAEALDLSRTLREQAAANFRGQGDAKLGLAHAQRDAANALEGLLERGLGSIGNSDLVNSYRSARQAMAKTYDAMAALDNSGNFDAKVLGRMMDRNRPLSGALKKAASLGTSFPESARTPESVGANPYFDQMSLWASLGLGGSGYGAFGPYGAAAAAIPMTRPLVRDFLLSGAAQNALARPNMMSRQDAAMLGTLPTVYQQSTQNKLYEMLGK